MDAQVVPANPPPKTPVVRGARACTVCRQAKMKCVGAEDGTKPCQRCIRSNSECIFEKHRRGRKPGSKLSEASKMLRRLEKGLNNAKAKQPANPAAPQSAAASGSFAHDEPAATTSYAGPSNNGTHSGQQSDDDMDEDEEEHQDDALYPAQVIRSSIRSSFLDVVMNPSPPENRLPSGSPTDRSSQYAPKAASQSPPRSHGSPQPKSCGDFFSFTPKDPVAAGIIPEEDVSKYFDAFFLRLNPFINLFDPALHSHEYVRSRSLFLFTAMLMACSKFFCPEVYPQVRRLAQEWCIYTFAEGVESVEVVQALACMTYWKEPSDRRTWQYIGMACRMAVNLRLNRYVGANQTHETHQQFLERRNKERTYLVLFVHDRSLSMQTGKHWMLPEDDGLVQCHRRWHEEVPMGQRTDIRPEDVIVAAFVNLRLIGSEATNTFYNRRSVFESELHKYNSKLDQWLEYWTAQMGKSPLADPFHSAFLKFFRSHVTLFLNSFGLNLSSEKSRMVPNREAVHHCELSAATNLQIVSKDFAGTHVLRYGQESVTVMSAYAAVVLLKLLRNPATSTLLGSSVDQIHHIINDAADAYQSAGHVTGSELNSAAYHARFLRHLTALDSAEHKSFRSDGIPPSFAQGLPPISAAQPPISRALHPLDPYQSQRHLDMGHPHLPPLAIPGGSNSSNGAHSFSIGHPDYTMDSAVRTNVSPGTSNRPAASYSSMPQTSESDQRYFDYILGEVGEVGEALFPNSGAPFMGGGSAVSGYQFPSSQYRDDPQMAYSHPRTMGYPISPMQYNSGTFAGSR